MAISKYNNQSKVKASEFRRVEPKTVSPRGKRGESPTEAQHREWKLPSDTVTIDPREVQDGERGPLPVEGIKSWAEGV